MKEIAIGVLANALVFLSWAAPAQAQTPPYIQADKTAVTKAFGPQVAAQIFSGAYTSMRQQTMRRSTEFIPGYVCPADPPIVLAMVTPFPIKPGAVSWIERYLVTCNPRTQRNFLTIIEGEPRMIELLPGTSRTDPALQRDALVGVKAAASAANPPGCTRSIVTDTNVTTPPDNATGLWQERWNVDLCGTKTAVDLTFTPSSRGGTDWSMKLAK